MRVMRFASLPVFLLLAVSAFASVFGSVRGVVHDPQHRPISGAMVMLQAKHSQWATTANTNASGEFTFAAVPLGEYTVTVASPGFEQTAESVLVESGTEPVLHYQLKLAIEKQNVTVSAAPDVVPTDTVTPTTLIDRSEVERTPGADRTNSLAMITDYVPAAYLSHDMLHMRGGHQIEWLVDGVPIPNTNIAANLGPMIDPKDIDYLEAQRGSYGADYGDRTYGIFNIAPRTGFERDRQCDLVLAFGNFYQTNDQLSCGGHSERFAYYLSGNGNRSNYGLETPIPQVFHDAANGYGGFTSLIFNPDPKNQLRLVGSLRQDYYQIPIDPDPNSAGNQIYDSSGLRDSEREPAGYLTFSWEHTFNPNLFVTVSPFYEYSGANYNAGANDSPPTKDVRQTAKYGGMQASVNANFWNNDVQAGVYGFGQHQYNFFQDISANGVNGGVVAVFVNDKFKLNQWITLIAGLRQTHSDADTSENATDPRFGVALRVPRLNWVFRGFYGYYYQSPPIVTATGALLQFANSQQVAFAPLRGERDIEWQFGVTIPYHGWILSADNYQTHARNWLDHSNIGESNLFWPITWNAALIQGWELTLRSPLIMRRGRLHLSYANQIAQATSPLTGGLVCPVPVTSSCPFDIPPGYGPVDHDQRNTLDVGFETSLPRRSYASVNANYGSGLTNGLYGTPQAQYPGPYLPGHTTFDLAVGKSFGEKYSVSINALNVANRRVQLDNSLTFGGFHWNDPRQIYAEFRYSFHY